MSEVHILVVEDDHETLKKIAQRLRYAGYQVTEATDGETALDLLETRPFHVVLTDIVMGEIDGIEVLHTARRMAYLPAVILLTGHASLDSCVAALRAGAYDYLIKPCSPEQLLGCIAGAVQRHCAEQALREAAELLTGHIPKYQEEPSYISLQKDKLIKNQQPSHMLQVGALLIGSSRHDVWFHDQHIRVTPIEYSLLRHLAERPEQWCSCVDIVHQTHGLKSSEIDSYGLIKSHIQNLRRKIDKSYLVKGEGYCYMLTAPNRE